MWRILEDDTERQALKPFKLQSKQCLLMKPQLRLELERKTS